MQQNLSFLSQSLTKDQTYIIEKFDYSELNSEHISNIYMIYMRLNWIQ